MAPEMACTMTYSKPSRLKILTYASRWAWYDFSSPMSSMSKE